MRILTLIGASIASITLGCMLPTLDFITQTMAFDISQYEKRGTQKPQQRTIDLLKIALSAMKVSHRHFITFYKTEGVPCAAGWHIWINEDTIFGPVEYEVFHEAAHIALGHFKETFKKPCSTELVKAQEVEADLLACKTLFELGMHDVIIKRIKNTRRFIDEGYTLSNGDTHPSLEEMYRYFMHFARSKGLEVV